MGLLDDLHGLDGPARIGLGLAALGRPGYVNVGHGDDLGSDRSPEALERRSHDVLDAAYAAGVRYVDVARSYGRAEDFLASWLATRDVPDVIVGSKWGYVYTADWQVNAESHEIKEHNLATLRRQLRETRERLGDRLRLEQIHSATFESGVLENREVLDELARLRDRGIAVGASVSGPRQAELIERIVELECFDAVQATWNLYERSASDALARARDAGLVVLVKEALANGRLTPRGDDTRVTAVAEELVAPSDALALAAALAQPWATVVLSGATTTEMLGHNLRALDLTYSTEVDKRLSEIREQPQGYWSRRSALPWT